MTRIRTALAVLAGAAALGCGTNGPATTEPAPSGATLPKDAGPQTAMAPGAGTGAAPPTTPPTTFPEDAGAPSTSDAAVPAPNPACAHPAWAPGTEQTVTLSHDGRARTYLVHVGKGTTGGAAPLVLNFHGLTNSPSIQVLFSNMSALADEQGFIVVYPQGIDASFNAGSCCGNAQLQGIDDVGFARAIVADVESKICVDSKRVYATGFSNGGFMANRLACEASDLFAAIAPVSGTNGVATCTPAHPMPVIAFFGTADAVVSFTNGEATIRDWAKRDACVGDPKRTAFGASYCDEWSQCDGGAKVKLCAIAGGIHLWPGDGASIPASPAIWEFFRQFTL